MTKENFKSFIPLLKKVAVPLGSKNPLYRQIDKYKGELLTLAYVKDLPDSKQLLEESLKVNDRLKLGMISFSSRNLNNPDEKIRIKSQGIYMRFINDNSDEVSGEYDQSFKNFEIGDFRKIYPLLVEYSKSRVIRKESHFFFKLLGKVVGYEPEKCINLIEPLEDFQVPPGRYSDFPRQVTQILIEAYNRTSQNIYREKAMNIFNSMLEKEFYRNEGLRVLSEQDRE
jgi:hypothetical protein